MIEKSVRAAAAATICVVATAVQHPAVALEPRHSAMIIDANTGTVLHNTAGDELRHPASLTKMMTLYMAFELIEMGRLNYNSKIKVTQEAAAAAPSKLELEPGEEIAVIDAIKALVTKSANDMAVALAQHIGGTEANFARLMTEKAHQLGMTRTVFRNASGLPDPEQVTTAHDMITLGLHLQDDFPKHYPLFGLRSFTYNGRNHRNHNTLLLSYRGTDGIKTGYTHASGFNLVASVHRDGKHLVGAIFGGESAASRNAHLRSLFERSFARASTEKTRKPAPMLVASARMTARTKPASLAKAEPPPPAAPKPAVQVAAVQPKPQPKPAHKPEAAAVAPKTTAQQAATAKPGDATPPSQAAAPSTPQAPAANAPAAPIVVAQVEPSPPLQAETAAAEAAAIDIAKVRRVMVAPRVKPRSTLTETADVNSTDVPPQAPAAAPTSPSGQPTFATASALGAPKADRLAAFPAPAAEAPIRQSETVVAKERSAVADASPADSRQPSSFEAQMAALAVKLNLPASPRVDTPQSEQVADATAAAPPPPAYRLKGPDPIGELAAADAAEPPAEVAPTAAASEVAPAARTATAPATEPAPSRTPPAVPSKAPQHAAGGTFQIQIGAFGSPVEANSRIASVRQAVSTLLNGHDGITLPVAKGDRTLYRARFAGFDSNGAASTCLELRRRQIDCFVMKAE